MLYILALMEEDRGGDLVPPLEHHLPTPSGEQLVNQQAIPEDSILDLEVRHKRRQSRSWGMRMRHERGGGGLSTQKMFPMFFFKIITISISDPPPNFWGRWFLPKFFKFYIPTKGSCMPDPMPLPGISLLNFYKRREVVDVLRLRIFHFLLWFWICLLHTW